MSTPSAQVIARVNKVNQILAKGTATPKGKQCEYCEPRDGEKCFVYKGPKAQTNKCAKCVDRGQKCVWKTEGEENNANSPEANSTKANTPEPVTIDSDEDEPPKRRERAKVAPKRKEVVEAGPSKKKAKMKAKAYPTSIQDMREALQELIDEVKKLKEEKKEQEIEIEELKNRIEKLEEPEVEVVDAKWAAKVQYVLDKELGVWKGEEDEEDEDEEDEAEDKE